MTLRRCAAPGRWLLTLASLTALAACGTKQAPTNGTGDSDPQEIASNAVSAGRMVGLPGTPMAERVAVIGLLNKRNGITRKLSMKPGQAFRVDNAIVRLRACEMAAPWEDAPEIGAFVQLDVRESRDNQWHRTFSGWLFKERPDRNVVQHPIYDVWVTSCAMTWPETGENTVRAIPRGSSGAAGSGSASNASESSAEKSGGDASGTSSSASSNSAE